jgi:tryptophanyl-tRNA synthetase
MHATAPTSADLSPTLPRPRRRVVTGFKPTGRLTVGNYVGAVRPTLALTADPGNDVLVLVADLHAMTVDHDPRALRTRTREVAATLLACGLGDGGTLFVQSAVPAHTELAYLLECTAAYGEMTRMIQFRQKARGRRSVRLSLLTYPALMAADVLLYQVDAVPVGDDQRQHLELTRALAHRFNARYGPVFTAPEALTPPSAARVKDLRDPASKMGKSAVGDGTVHVLDDPTRIAAAVRRAVTDLDPLLSYDPDLRPGVANLADLLGAFTGRTPQAALAGLRGAGSLKSAVTEALVETLRPVRRRYADLTADTATLDAVLAAGAGRAAALAAPTLAAARAAIGLAGPDLG